MNETSDIQGEKLEAVIEKIRRLQSLAGNNKSIEEVCTANTIANQMMQKYRLTQAMIDSRRVKLANNFVRQDICTVSKRNGAYETLLSAIAKTYSGKWYMTSRAARSTTYILAAEEQDFLVCEYFFMTLVEELEGLAAMHCKGQGHQFGHSWRLGCAAAISESFAKIRAERDRENAANTNPEMSQAIVLLSNRGKEVEKWLASQISLRSGSSLSGAKSGDGYAHGKKVGAGVNIRMGMNGSGNKPTGQLGG
jgi:hypothetical protein